jgi:uncharacterized membrane protein
MENLVFTTFADEKSATDGLKKLQELDQIGDIVIYNVALIKKNSDGSLTLLHHEGPEASSQPAAGAAVGSLIGLLAGPVGMGIGLLTGALVGAADEDDDEDVTRQFLDKADKQLAPGSLAVVMDVEEDTTFMIDSYMAAYKGVTLHSPIDDEYDEADSKQWEELDAEIDESEAALASAVEKDKAQVKDKLDALKEKKAKLTEQMKDKASKREKHWHDKIQAFDKKVKQANDETSKKLKAKQEELHQKLEKYRKAVANAFN